MATALAPRPESRGERVYHSGDAFFGDLLRAIETARERIDLEAYIFESDEFGRRVAQALVRAVRRGVRVRLLVDGVGSPWFARDFLKPLRRAGIDARIYHPAPWRSLGRFFELLAKMNRRDHRKMYVIDGHVAWVGSMNVSACHLRSLSGAEAWRDSGVRIEGEHVGDLLQAFEAAWSEAWPYGWRAEWQFKALKRWWRRRTHPLLRLNDTRARREHSYHELLKRIASAKRRVWIINAYFVPRAALVRALCRAARNGADVRLILPSQCDVFFIPWVSSAFYSQLLRSGVRIYEYVATMCHAKTCVIDNWATVGSSNMNHRSLMHDLEVDVVIATPEGRDSLARQFELDLAQAREVRLEEWKKRPWLERLLCRTLLLIRHWV